MSAYEYPDIYTISKPPAADPHTTIIPEPGQLLTFRLQKFHYHVEIQRYQPMLQYHTTLQLEIQDCQLKSTRHHTLPYILNGHPRPLTTPLDHQNDPVLRSLHPLFRMTFRYDPLPSVGCLVHFGYDLGQPEQTALYPLWLTALNLEDITQQTSRFSASI